MKAKQNKKLLKLLGARIRKLRLEQGLSQAQLAFESGIHRDQIGRIELGKQGSSITVLAAIAGSMEMELKDLFDFDY